MSCTAPDLGEEGSHEDCPYGGKKRAATRTAPTAERRGQPRGLPLRREEEGSHEDCPTAGRRGQYEDCPYAGRRGQCPYEDCPYGGKRGGQPRGLPLRREKRAGNEEGSHEGLPLRREEEGSHEDCPYGGKKRAATRTARREKRAICAFYSDLAQVANLRYRLPGISVCSTFSIQAHAAKALETIRRASFSSHSRRVAYGLSLQ